MGESNQGCQLVVLRFWENAPSNTQRADEVLLPLAANPAQLHIVEATVKPCIVRNKRQVVKSHFQLKRTDSRESVSPPLRAA